MVILNEVHCSLLSYLPFTLKGSLLRISLRLNKTKKRTLYKAKYVALVLLPV